MKLDSKHFDRIRVKPDQDRRKAERAPVCAWPGCKRPGTHKAPRGRQFEGQYLDFCLDHVRDYNKAYNFFQGLDDDAVSDILKDAITGHRPTWKLGENSWASAKTGRKGAARGPDDFADPFDLFDGARRPERARPARTARNAELKALHSLGLDENASPGEVKSRYKALVKRLHPDANGGSRDTEDKLREVIQAYDYLCSSGYC
ncbi:MAG TPA: DnaJ domain-containing protein [Aestuariivirgaceae bacterium]|nr:DnaJ domain-containing protein [Aestuariivirgaceae bacterium]